VEKAMSWLVQERTSRQFLINAAPGAGKTIASCAIANALIEQGEIERVIVIAPRSEVVNQWARDFIQVTGRHMTKVTGRDGDVGVLGVDICATWSATQGLMDAIQAVCKENRTLVICDEHHHAAVEAVWGESANSAFSDASFVVVLTGTPIRSDGVNSIWLAYDDAGAIDQPDAGTYTLTYGDAVDLGYCRPVTFHRHEGRFTIDLENNETIQVSGQQAAEFSGNLTRIPALQRALDFYRLASTPQYEDDNQTPLLSGYQATMLDWGSDKLNELRDRMPNAGGLVITPSIEMAKYMASLIEKIEGEKPVLVHSQVANPEAKISAFRNTDKRWLVSVAMISEGIDIPRLRVMIYLPNPLTELAFRQAIGRVVRSVGPEDDTRAYVVMPSFDTFENYARRVEGEMSAAARAETPVPTTRCCPICTAECEKGAKECSECGYEFPERPERLKTCDSCDSLNPVAAAECQACGQTFSPAFVLTLDEALRTGAIARGLDLNEEEVQMAEDIAQKVRSNILRSGDEKLLRMLRMLPDESWGRLKTILES
jgi:superfamily II DNA or RNA helicase